MDEVKFYEFLLSLPDLGIDTVEHSSSKIVLGCHYQCKSRSCPQCGHPTGIIHQYDTRKVHDLSISGKEVWLLLFHPSSQYHCRLW